MALDNRGIHQFTEADDSPNWSSTLNKLAVSVSNSKAFFKGTPAQRDQLLPIPTGAFWQDTDTAKRLWKEETGSWTLWETPWTTGIMTTVGSEPSARHRIIDGMVEIAGAGSKIAATYGCFVLPVGRRPSRQLTYVDPSATARQIQVTTGGAVNSTDINALSLNFGSIRFYPAS